MKGISGLALTVTAGNELAMAGNHAGDDALFQTLASGQVTGTVDARDVPDGAQAVLTLANGEEVTARVEGRSVESSGVRVDRQTLNGPVAHQTWKRSVWAAAGLLLAMPLLFGASYLDLQKIPAWAASISALFHVVLICVAILGAFKLWLGLARYFRGELGYHAKKVMHPGAPSLGSGLTVQGLFFHSLVSVVITGVLFVLAPWVPVSIRYGIFTSSAVVVTAFLSLTVLSLLRAWKLIVPGPDGYRLRDTLWKWVHVTKIGWLKYQYPILAARQGEFDPEAPHSLYRRIPYTQTLVLSQLHPTLPATKVTLVNELNADLWTQLMAMPLAMVHQYLFLESYRDASTRNGKLRNVLAFVLNNMAFLPAAVGALVFLPIYSAIYAVWYDVHRRRHNRRNDLIGHRLRLYLKDFRDSLNGTKYEESNFSYMNSDPLVPLPYQTGPSPLGRLSDLIRGKKPARR